MLVDALVHCRLASRRLFHPRLLNHASPSPGLQDNTKRPTFAALKETLRYMYESAQGEVFLR